MASSPIIPGFFPDPSICRFEDMYVLVNSTFEYLPGVPIHVSKDLLHWEHVGNVFSRREQLDLSDAPSNAGVYAPTIRHHQGRFYIVTTDLETAPQGQLITSTDDIYGTWTVPVRVPGTVGIDPDLFWDSDGTCHLTWRDVAGADGPGISSVSINPDSGEVLGTVTRMWQGIPGLADAEGPHLYRRGDWYYCMLAQGGTNHGHTVTIARAKSLSGPWEACPANPILTHRSTDLPVQNTGHADLVQTPDGDWVMVHLGVRPRGMVPKFTTNGRESFLVGIDWVDDWPVVREDAFTVPETPTQFVDDFAESTLHPRWFSHGGAQWDCVDTSPAQGIIISPVAKDAKRPALSVRARDNQWSSEAILPSPQSVAMQLRMDSDNWVEVTVADGQAHVIQSVTGRVQEIAAQTLDRPAQRLVISAEPWPPERHFGAGPDLVVLSVGTESGLIELARIDGRLLSSEVTAGFTGRTIGLRAIDGPARIQRFSYTPVHTGPAMDNASGAR